MLLVPAVMHLLGRANWWLPAWLGRLLPELHVEGRPEVHLPAPGSAASPPAASAGGERDDVDRCHPLDPGAVVVAVHLAPRPPEVQTVVLELEDGEVVVVPGPLLHPPTQR